GGCDRRRLVGAPRAGRRYRSAFTGAVARTRSRVRRSAVVHRKWGPRAANGAASAGLAAEARSRAVPGGLAGAVQAEPGADELGTGVPRPLSGAAAAAHGPGRRAGAGARRAALARAAGGRCRG